MSVWGNKAYNYYTSLHVYKRLIYNLIDQDGIPYSLFYKNEDFPMHTNTTLEISYSVQDQSQYY